MYVMATKVSIGMTKNAPTRSRRDENSDATRTDLVLAAKQAFAVQGFRKAAIESIAQQARVTRGAFYHHFTNKSAIFDAVVVELQKEAVEGILAKTRVLDDPWEILIVGTKVYLGIARDPIYNRLVVVDAPGVLGVERYRQIDDDYPVGLVIATVKSLHKKGILVGIDPEILGRMIAAITCEAASLLTTSTSPKKIEQTTLDLIERTLRSYMQ